MPSPDRLGASGRWIEVDLTEPGLTFPVLFQPLFAAKYPTDPTLTAQAVSRTIVALSGNGVVTLIEGTSDANGDPIESDVTLAEGGYRGLQAIGVADAGDIAMIAVYL